MPSPNPKNMKTLLSAGRVMDKSIDEGDSNIEEMTMDRTGYICFGEYSKTNCERIGSPLSFEIDVSAKYGDRSRRMVGE